MMRLKCPSNSGEDTMIASHATVGSSLLDEIERVSAKRERWKGYNLGLAGAPGIFLMTQAIERGKRSVQMDDPAEAIAALRDLQDFDDND